jgi:aldose sugar dehydrogenase
MARIVFFVFFFLGLTILSRGQTYIQIGNTTVKADTLITGLDVPWEIICHTDGHLWITERKGIVSRINLSTGVKSVILDITAIVTQQSESGLLGMAHHPDFENYPEVFLAYTYTVAGNIRERIVKYTYNNGILENEQILLNDIPGNSTHNGCRLLILPDNTLLASTGDAQNLSLPQNTSSLNGKILRMNFDGSIPADNPFQGSLVYSFGHRNPQGLALLPNNTVLVSEHGASTDDEIQLLHAGRNYGWPNVEGFCNTSNEITFCQNNQVVEPLNAYTPTIAPSDLVFYSNPGFPEWDQCALVTVLKDKEIRALKMNSEFNQISSDISYLKNRFGRLRDIAIGPDKEIYLATNGASWANTDPNTHTIIRLTPLLTSNSPWFTNVRSAISVYPNPAGSEITIRFSDEILSGGYQIKLLNSAGQLVYQNKVIQNRHVIYANGKLSSGLYFLHLINSQNETIEVKKIVLE